MKQLAIQSRFANQQKITEKAKSSAARRVQHAKEIRPGNPEFLYLLDRSNLK
jgi:hypothetical protein